MGFRSVWAGLFLVAIGFGAGWAQKPTPSSAPTGPVELQKQPDVVKGAVQAFPHIVPGPAVTQAVADKINAALVRADVRAKSAAQECQSSLKEADQKPDPDAWSRTIQITMRGPRFLSFVAQDGYFCGGAHPDGGQLALVYDLQTGSPVNWLKLLPVGVKASLDTATDGSRVGLVQWPAARRIAVKGADQECTEAWESYPDMHFSLSLNGAAGELEATPTDFAHAEAPCADDVSISLSQLVQMKAAPELIDALKAAKSLQY